MTTREKAKALIEVYDEMLPETSSEIAFVSGAIEVARAYLAAQTELVSLRAEVNHLRTRLGIGIKYREWEEIDK